MFCFPRLRADLYFESDQAVDFHDQLMVLVGRSEGEMEQITIPVTALLPCARMELDTTMNFGPVVHQTSVTRQLLVRNTGERPGTLNFVPPAEKGGPKFAVHPASGVVDAGKQRLLKVECPADLPLGNDPYTWELWIRFTGHGPVFGYGTEGNGNTNCLYFHDSFNHCALRLRDRTVSTPEPC